MVDDALVFVLPDGRTTAVHPRSARLICNRLWDLGITPGAATAAARISDALHSLPALRPKVTFTEREVAPLMEASEAHPPTWMHLLNPGTPVTIEPDQRRRLLAKCDELIERLTNDNQQDKLRALLADLQQLRARLRATD